MFKKREDFIQSMIEREEKTDEPTTKDNEQSKDDEDTKSSRWNSSLKKTLTDKDIIAQSILFLVAGYETTAITLEFISYNLAMNQDVQDHLLCEIDDVLERHV